MWARLAHQFKNSAEGLSLISAFFSQTCCWWFSSGQWIFFFNLFIFYCCNFSILWEKNWNVSLHFSRVSWLSLMFFSTASCYPAGQGKPFWLDDGLILTNWLKFKMIKCVLNCFFLLVFDYSQARSWSSGVDTDQQPLVLPTRRQQHAEDPHGPPSSAVSPPWSPGHGGKTFRKQFSVLFRTV